MKNLKTWWKKVINSRFLAVLGGATFLLLGGYAVTTMAQAQGVPYTVVSTDTINSLQSQINALASRVSTLEAQVNNFHYKPIPQPVTTTYPTTVTTYPTYSSYPTYSNYPTTVTQTNAVGPQGQPVINGPTVIDQNGGTYVAGFDIYFTGRGFAPFEQVLVMRGGVTVGHTTADAGGNISTSGVLLPLGASTYTFTGQTSGVSSSATVYGATSVT
jgi:hypothetical protein